ncbi:NACHT domain-containing protein [Mycena sanguinolenta]|uniref:NACHT domain-containing protein n=1 Tax=Mycena sanguinolenta TaxID=230812 RepID=A0A8H6Z8Q0_9AGAR|nr:NACHT domain-containing protein [Mycena sanguinolenta]
MCSSAREALTSCTVRSRWRPCTIQQRATRSPGAIPKRARKCWTISINGHWSHISKLPFSGCTVPQVRGNPRSCKTLASQLQDASRLGGCFFFKRGHSTCGNGNTLFATIAYQLALNVPWLRKLISQVAESDPSIVARSIETQMRKLVSNPSSQGGNCEPVAIIIDGLDECNGHDVQRQILRVIRDASSKHPIFLRFIVASRPEAHIREIFDSLPYLGIHRPFNVEQSFADVRKYLCDEFSRIHHEHYTMAKIPLPWPSTDVLEKLVRTSSGHFIFASTIIKFIDDKSYRPTERLAMVQDPNGSGSKSAFATLDKLYMTILSSAPRQSQLIPIMCAIVHFEFRLGAGDIDKLFGLPQGETRLILRGLHSVLNVPSENENEISLHHASFVDFLNHPDRSSNFSVGIFNNQITLARSLLQYYAGPFQRHRISTLSNLIRFIVSLPCSGGVAELFPLIGSINPDYIFDPLAGDDYFGIVSWLKNIPSAPDTVIQLWEDYVFMYSIERWSTPAPSVNRSISPSPELIRILISMWFPKPQLWKLPTKLDLTWNDLKTTLCSLRPKFVEDEPALPPQRKSTVFRMQPITYLSDLPPTVESFNVIMEIPIPHPSVVKTLGHAILLDAEAKSIVLMRSPAHRAEAGDGGRYPLA